MAMPGIKKPDILQVVQSAGVELRQRGERWWGSCPLHKEKTASFTVDVAKQRFHCFGCAESGDVFDFTMKLKGFSFPEALRALRVPGGLRGGSNRVKIDPQRERKQTLSEAFSRWCTSAVRDLCDEIWLMNVVDFCVRKPSDLEIPGLTEVYLDRECAEYQLGVLTGNDFGAKVELFKSREGALCHTN